MLNGRICAQHLAVQLPAENPFGNKAGGKQAVQIDAGVHIHLLESRNKVFGYHVAALADLALIHSRRFPSDPAEARVDFHLAAPVTVQPVSAQEAARLAQGLYPGGPSLYRRGPYGSPYYYGSPYAAAYPYYGYPPVYYRPYYMMGGFYYWR